VLVLVVCAVVVGVSLLVLAILGYGLWGQLRRLMRAVEKARAELVPAAEALRPESAAGRHRAGDQPVAAGGSPLPARWRTYDEPVVS